MGLDGGCGSQSELCYVATTCALKLSIAFFLLRIANENLQRIILYVTMSVVIFVTIRYFFFMVFQCTPVQYFGYSSVPYLENACRQPWWEP